MVYIFSHFQLFQSVSAADNVDIVALTMQRLTALDVRPVNIKEVLDKQPARCVERGHANKNRARLNVIHVKMESTRMSKALQFVNCAAPAHTKKRKASQGAKTACLDLHKTGPEHRTVPSVRQVHSRISHDRWTVLTVHQVIFRMKRIKQSANPVWQDTTKIGRHRWTARRVNVVRIRTNSTQPAVSCARLEPFRMRQVRLAASCVRLDTTRIRRRQKAAWLACQGRFRRIKDNGSVEHVILVPTVTHRDRSIAISVNLVCTNVTTTLFVNVVIDKAYSVLCTSIIIFDSCVDCVLYQKINIIECWNINYVMRFHVVAGVNDQLHSMDEHSSSTNMTIIKNNKKGQCRS